MLKSLAYNEIHITDFNAIISTLLRIKLVKYVLHAAITPSAILPAETKLSLHQLQILSTCILTKWDKRNREKEGKKYRHKIQILYLSSPAHFPTQTLNTSRDESYRIINRKTYLKGQTYEEQLQELTSHVGEVITLHISQLHWPQSTPFSVRWASSINLQLSGCRDLQTHTQQFQDSSLWYPQVPCSPTLALHFKSCTMGDDANRSSFA